MAKINDTTLFPIRPPAADDILIGSDVSDTSNSPGGETVNFKVEDLFLSDSLNTGLAAIGAGEIGSYVFAYSTGGDVSFGSTVAGSTLRPTSAARGFFRDGSGGTTVNTGFFTVGSALSGTWRCMGSFDSITQVQRQESSSDNWYGATLWLRIL